MYLRPILSICLAAFVSMIALGAQAQQAQPSANDLQELSRILSDARIQEWLKTQTNEAEATARDESQPIRNMVEGVIQSTRTRLSDLGRAWINLDEVPALISERWQAQLPPAVQVRSLTFVLIFLFFGAGLEWLVRQYVNPIRKRIEFAKYLTAPDRLRAALYRTGLETLCILVFALGTIGAFSAFSWPSLLQSLILNALMVIVATRAVGAVMLLFLAPRVEQLRLVPIATRPARMLWRVLTIGSAALFICVGVVDLFGQLSSADGGSEAPEVLAIAVVCALVLLVMTIVGTRACFRAFHGVSARAQRTWQAYILALSVAVFALWLVNLQVLVWTVLLLGLLYPVINLVSAWVHSAFDRATREFRERHATGPAATPAVTDEDTGDVPDEEEPATDEVIDPYEAHRPIVVRIARFAVVIVVGLTLASVWNVGVLERTDDPSIAQRLFSILLDSAVALLIADLVWTWGRNAIDRRMAAYRPPEDGSAPGPEARMATLLPLLRVVLQITLLSMVAMSILAAAGVNIAPILAGASVMGIAIGFGAQSLVKDVVSGIFFLIDDAFRVGEYVEIDQLRGTVEKISIRSMQIRHHRGAVHTLPFGELKHITNHSRDWVIMKLEFRVPFDTDLKLVKKLIKKVGADLKANEFYGDGIIETLKSQGVRRMEEFNMVVGVKFMTRPGEQWLVRRDAYQGVRDIFEANGIRMAERNVKVEIAGEEELSDEARKAASAAAQEATQQTRQPTAIPDEP